MFVKIKTPDGDDDYFDRNGKLVLQTKTGSAIKVVTGEGVVNLSEVPLNTANNIQAVSNIAVYYATIAGVRDPAGLWDADL